MFVSLFTIGHLLQNDFASTKINYIFCAVPFIQQEEVTLASEIKFAVHVTDFPYFCRLILSYMV